MSSKTARSRLFGVDVEFAYSETWIAYALFAGCAIGLAFFARPYTAVLFALPFVVDAKWEAIDRRWQRLKS